ncbi:MAG: YeeE/YedE family protein [Burkholderiales bacterium]
MEELSTRLIVSIAGAVIGAIFGFIVERTNFCTMGAVSDAVAMNDFRRARAWALAIAVAILGAQGLQLAGFVDLQKSIYLGSSLGWLGGIIGGLMFGFGMTLSGGCASRNLVRFGAGDVRSLIVVVVLGIFAYITMRGLIAPSRMMLEGATNIDLGATAFKSQGIPELLAGAFGGSLAAIRAAATLVVALAILWFCFKDADFRDSPTHIVSGVGIGLVIIAGWWVTGVLGFDEFEPTRPSSLTYTAPVGNTLVYLMTYSGASIEFGIASVVGAIAGAYLSAILRKSFSLAGFADRSDLFRNLGGAALMGTGGVMALGCTVGQGLTGISTLSLGSLIALASIVAGGVLGIKYLERQMV